MILFYVLMSYIIVVYINSYNQGIASNTGCILIGIYFGLLVVSIIVFGLANAKLIDENTFDLVRQDATYYDPETMSEEKFDEKVNEENKGDIQKLDAKEIIDRKKSENEKKIGDEHQKLATKESNENEPKLTLKINNTISKSNPISVTLNNKVQ